MSQVDQQSLVLSVQGEYNLILHQGLAMWAHGGSVLKCGQVGQTQVDGKKVEVQVDEKKVEFEVDQREVDEVEVQVDGKKVGARVDQRGMVYQMLLLNVEVLQVSLDHLEQVENHHQHQHRLVSGCLFEVQSQPFVWAN